MSGLYKVNFALGEAIVRKTGVSFMNSLGRTPHHGSRKPSEMVYQVEDINTNRIDFVGEYYLAEIK